MELKQSATARFDAVEAELIDISHWMYHNPEIAFEEFHTSQRLVDFLRRQGFEVEYPSFGLDTAFAARAGSDGPVQNVNRRMDALRECVQRLGKPQQELLHHAYSSDQSIRQLAARLGKAVQTIYNRLFRIRRLLFDCVESRLAAEEPS